MPMEQSQLIRGSLYNRNGQQYRLMDWSVLSSRPSQVSFILMLPVSGGPSEWLYWPAVKDFLTAGSDVSLEQEIAKLEAELDALKAKLIPKSLPAPTLSVKGTVITIDPVKDAEYYEFHVVVMDGGSQYLKGPIATIKELSFDVAAYAKEFNTFAVVAFGGGLRSDPATITVKLPDPGGIKVAPSDVPKK